MSEGEETLRRWAARVGMSYWVARRRWLAGRLVYPAGPHAGQPVEAHQERKHAPIYVRPPQRPVLTPDDASHLASLLEEQGYRFAERPGHSEYPNKQTNTPPDPGG